MEHFIIEMAMGYPMGRAPDHKPLYITPFNRIVIPMKGLERNVIDLRSQDLDICDLEKFRIAVIEQGGKESPEELIMFSSSSKPYQFGSILEFEESIGSIPDDASYFYYTLTFKGGERCSLYLDPDRPGQVVIEGPKDWAAEMEKKVLAVFPRGGERYRVHQKFGILMIWGMVVLLAGAILLATSLVYEMEPILVSVIIFTSSILGIYLSIVKSKELQPANTISFVKRRKFWLVTLLHLVTIALGIICAVMATVIVKGLF